MNTSRTSAGFTLALTTAICWGVLPIALSIALTGTDAYTLTWFRFLTAAIAFGGFLAFRHGFPDRRALQEAGIGLLVIAFVGLAGNFVLFLVGLHLTSPAVTQVTTQLSSVFLLLGGVLFFKERLSVVQWAGAALLLAGLMMFFRPRFAELMGSGAFNRGVWILVLASAVWACFGLAQKKLLIRLQSPQILCLIFTAATIALFPATTPGDIASFNALQAIMLAFCCANTLVAYGSLSEALKRWEASRVGAVLAVTPLVTIVATASAHAMQPSVVPSDLLTSASLLGGCIVAAGSALVALGRARQRSG